MDASNDAGNLHNAIDISCADAGTDTIRAVEAGVFRDCRPMNQDSTEWFAHIFGDGSSYGWHYGHVQGDDGIPLSLDSVDIGIDTCAYGDYLGTMSDATPEMHLHFRRTDQYTFSNGDPGIDNPLEYLDPPPDGLDGYKWKMFPSDPAIFFLPQRDAIYGDSSWAEVYDPPDSSQASGHPSLVLADTLDRNSLSGDVDILYGCHSQGYPPTMSVTSSGIPQRIGWDLLDWTEGSDWKPVQTRYLVDFDGEL